jgi:hypothetical protein
MKNKFLFALLVLPLFIIGCKKHSESNTSSTPAVHTFNGIVAIDDVGMNLGTWGTELGDWETDSVWSPDETALLAFPDTVTLNGTFIKDTTGWNTGPGIHEQPKNIVIAFPNPASSSQTLILRALGLVKMKAVIVDNYFNRLITFARKDSIADIMIDVSDLTKFKSGSIYRMYYSLSVTGNLNFYTGHGDILICRERVFQDCEKYVP